MASSSLTTGSSGPSWQVDIPGLSQLILNVGSHGLKQLAMAGVDIHSLGCMLMIAEFTPASQEFRKKITHARKFQRSERLWLYKVVEIGASTNFLADQLLKTRAGENVLALMAATVPVMNEDTCTSALIALFEGAKVSLDNIPGTNQLRAIRTGLAPLARKIGFGEKVLNYHRHLWMLNEKRRQMPQKDPYFSIPESADIASIIRMLHKIMTHDERYIFICWGLRGAAWITAYAIEVLGLAVCAIGGDRRPVPISGSYEDAKIIIELDSPDRKCSLHLEKDLYEQFQLQDQDPASRNGWSVDCTNINFLEYRHPNITESPSYERISFFVALETLNNVSALTLSFPRHHDLHKQGWSGRLVTYAVSELEHIQCRSLRILRQLGFRPGMLQHYRFQDNTHELAESPTYTATGHVGDADHQNYQHDKKRAMVGVYHFPGQFPAEDRSNRISKYFCDSKQHRHTIPPGSSWSYGSSYLDWQKELRDDLAETISSAAYFASHLAFSDWDVTLRLMSIEFLHHGFRYHGSHENPEESSIRYDVFDTLLPAALSLCSDSISMSMVNARLWSEDWIALDLDGVVVFRNAARNYSIHDLHAKFLGFSVGKIVFEGNVCSKVRADRMDLDYANAGAKHKGVVTLTSIPKSEYLDLSLRTLFSTANDTLFVRLEGFFNSERILVGDASIPGYRLSRYLVTRPCVHGYYSPGDPSMLCKHGIFHANPTESTTACPDWHDTYSWFTMHQVHVTEGLTFTTPLQGLDILPAPPPLPPGMTRYSHQILPPRPLDVHYQQVDNNPLGQWLACHSSPSALLAPIIIQKDCCFSCILKMLIDPERQFPIPYVCVIAGGISHQAKQTPHRPTTPPVSSFMDPIYAQSNALSAQSPKSSPRPLGIGEIEDLTLSTDADLPAT